MLEPSLPSSPLPLTLRPLIFRSPLSKPPPLSLSFPLRPPMPSMTDSLARPPLLPPSPHRRQCRNSSCLKESPLLSNEPTSIPISSFPLDSSRPSNELDSEFLSSPLFDTTQRLEMKYRISSSTPNRIATVRSSSSLVVTLDVDRRESTLPGRCWISEFESSSLRRSLICTQSLSLCYEKD